MYKITQSFKYKGGYRMGDLKILWFADETILMAENADTDNNFYKIMYRL